MNELHELLARATDRIESPHLEQVALEAATRRRAHRRGAAAAAAASAAVVAVFAGMQVAGSPDGPRVSAPPGEAPTGSSSASPPTVEVEEWPQWDPRELDLLPAAAARIAPALPDVIEPPDSSPLLADDPVGAGVLVVEQAGLAQVLGTDGDWRTVPIDGRYPQVALSPQGTRLAVAHGYDSRAGERDDGVRVHDLATGNDRTVQPPSGFEAWDTGRWTFLDEDTLLYSGGPRAYMVAVDSGAAEGIAVPVAMSSAVDPSGDWLTSTDFSGPKVLVDHDGGAVREVDMDRTGRLLRIQASEDTVVGTTHDNQDFAVVVADRSTLTPQSRLPVLDRDGNYSNWGLTPVALTDDGTVLLQVADIGRRVSGFRLVAWDPATGELSIVASTSVPVEATVVFAQDALRVTGR
ncbi:hypothetical protein IEQ44_10500 [Nocardioides sp. Y6]|uniref:WD40 repeat domain-containing protein n=1 Tax=Nocardioides malaquae TaxID=2773426 RepID=A0ABR9RU47_9ACTN|nr:hypothetical protein [Nocardioides malaquae]MBE7325089.1 hypothetical protein [Nocardioides malaquae]